MIPIRVTPTLPVRARCDLVPVPFPEAVAPVLYAQYQYVLSFPGASLASVVQLATFCLRCIGLADIPGMADTDIGRFGILMVVRPDTLLSREQYDDQAILYLALTTASDPQTALIIGRVQFQAPATYRRTPFPATIQKAIATIGGTTRLVVVDPALGTWRYKSEPFTPPRDCPRLLVAVLDNPQVHHHGSDDTRFHYIVLGIWPGSLQRKQPGSSLPPQITTSLPEHTTHATLATILGL